LRFEVSHALDARGEEGGHLGETMPAPAESNKIRTIAIVIAAVVVAIVVAFALLQQPPPAPAQPQVAIATPTPADTPASFATAYPRIGVVTSTPAPNSPAGASPAWEAMIDQILRSNVTEAQMAQMLINLLPTLPEDGQIEAANHIANLLPDSDYNSVRPLLLNASLPESVLSVFFTDLMNRDDTTKLNSFLDIAQMPNHPFHDEALSDLQIYVGDDYGTDWGKWQSAVSNYLKTANQQ
jgi:hypothetical protein